MYCKKRIPAKTGFPLIETLAENCPVELVTLAHQFGGQIIETKKGYKIKWQ